MTFLSRSWGSCLTAVILFFVFSTVAFGGVIVSDNAARIGTATASSEYWPAANAINGVTSGPNVWEYTWAPVYTEMNSWLNVELHFPARIEQVNILSSDMDAYRAHGNYSLLAKTDGSTTYSQIAAWTSDTTDWENISFTPIDNVTDVKLEMESLTGYCLALKEFEVIANNPITIIDGGSTAGDTNLALVGTGIAKNYFDDPIWGAYTPDRINDGSNIEYDYWLAPDGDPTWAGVALSTPSVIDRIALGGSADADITYRSAGIYGLQYTTDNLSGVDLSDPAALDALSWSNIGAFVFDEHGPEMPRTVFQFDPIEDVTAVRSTLDSMYGASLTIAEFEVYAADPSLWATPGDANCDGAVNETDVAILTANWLGSGSWGQGDFNGDDVVDDKDATILAANWQSSAASVPEPGCFAMFLVLLGAALTVVTRRNSQ